MHRSTLSHLVIVTLLAAVGALGLASRRADAFTSCSCPTVPPVMGCSISCGHNQHASCQQGTDPLCYCSSGGGSSSCSVPGKPQDMGCSITCTDAQFPQCECGQFSTCDCTGAPL